MTDWQPNNEYNNEVNNEIKTRDSDESLQTNINIVSEEIWRIFENEERTDPALAAGRSNRVVRKKYQNPRRYDIGYEEEQRDNQELVDSTGSDWMGREW